MQILKKYPTLKEANEFIDSLLSSPSDEELVEIYRQYKGYPPSVEQLAHYRYFVEGIKAQLPNCLVTTSFEKVDYIPIGWTQLFNKLLKVKNA